MSIETTAVTIVWRTPSLVAAVVRDGSGIATVRYTRTSGWSCSTDPDEKCAHVLAVIQTVTEDHADA